MKMNTGDFVQKHQRRFLINTCYKSSKAKEVIP